MACGTPALTEQFCACEFSERAEKTTNKNIFTNSLFINMLKGRGFFIIVNHYFKNVVKLNNTVHPCKTTF
jgi:hypothetical protein